MAIEVHDAYMSVRQVAEYLHLNEKKIYELVKDQSIPATKVTGKWLFPRGMVDRWLTESSNSGVLTDRLNIAGSDDPLLQRLVLSQTQEMDSHGLVNYTATGTRMGLKLLQARRIDAACLHWGPSEESSFRHPALLKQHRQHSKWVLIHLFNREQGLIVHPDVLAQVSDHSELYDANWQWVGRQSGAGSQRFLMEALIKAGQNVDDLNQSVQAHSEKEAASFIVMRQADVASGPRAVAIEAGLEFISMGWESFDIALNKGIWFRNIFQTLLKRLQSDEAQKLAVMLQGYDLSRSGELLWGES